MQKSNKFLICLVFFLFFSYIGYSYNNYFFDSRVVCTAKISELKFPRKDGTMVTINGFVDLDMKNETVYFFFQSPTGDFVNRMLHFTTSYAVNGEVKSAVIDKKIISRSEYGNLGDEYHLYDVGTKHLLNMIPITDNVTQVSFGPLSFFCENEERI